MRTKLIALSLAATLGLPTLAQARPVTFTTVLTAYKGDGAYVALYLTDAKGQYQQTLWVAGKKPKYYTHLRDWARGSGLRNEEYDGLTGASVTSGRTLNVTLDLADSLIDSGHQVRIDTSVEDMRDNRSEVAVPLTTEGVGKSVPGKGYVKSFTYKF
jgi:hypothetical protein